MPVDIRVEVFVAIKKVGQNQPEWLLSQAATQIVDLFKEDRERITMESDRAGSALRVHELFQQSPFHTAD